jgi:hypothetical protein
MRKTIFFVLLVISIEGFSQDTIPARLPGLDSIEKELSNLRDSLDASMRKVEDLSPDDLTRFDPGPLIEYQQDLERKKKNRAMVRIAIGLFFLGVLAFSLVRRKKKNRPGSVS